MGAKFLYGKDPSRLPNGRYVPKLHWLYPFFSALQVKSVYSLLAHLYPATLAPTSSQHSRNVATKI